MKLLSVLFLFITLNLSGQTGTMNEALKEAAKKELSNMAKKEIAGLTDNDALGGLAGDAVLTIFNHFDKRAEARNGIRDQISDANNQLLHLKYNDHEGDINRLKFSPDSKYIVTGGDDETVIIRSVLDGSIVKNIQLDKNIYDIKFNENGTYMAIITPGEIQIWDMATISLYKSIERKNSGELAVLTSSLLNFHPIYKNQIIYFDPKKTLTAYDFENDTILFQGEVSTESIAAKAAKAYLTYGISTTKTYVKSWIIVPEDGYNLVIQSPKETYLWDLTTSEVKTVYQKNKGGKQYVGIPYSILNDGQHLYTSSKSEVIVYDLHDGTLVENQEISIATTLGQAYDEKILFSPDEEFFMVAGVSMFGEDEVISLDFYKRESMEKLLSFPSDLTNSKERYHYDWSRNGKYIANLAKTMM